MSQDERLLEAKLPLLVLMECIRGAIPAAHMVQWFAFRPPVRYAVDTDLMHLQVPRAGVPELFKETAAGSSTRSMASWSYACSTFNRQRCP